jgi:hypothetical protein
LKVSVNLLLKALTGTTLPFINPIPGERPSKKRKKGLAVEKTIRKKEKKVEREVSSKQESSG